MSVDTEVDLPGYRPRVTGNPRQIRLAAEAINAAERPVLYVGGGVISANAPKSFARSPGRVTSP